MYFFMSPGRNLEHCSQTGIFSEFLPGRKREYCSPEWNVLRMPSRTNIVSQTGRVYECRPLRDLEHYGPMLTPT